MTTTLCEPKVYLLGTQQVNDEGMEQFLADIGQPEFATDARGAGEVLVETGGRVCYMSFSNPRPGGMAAYAKNILACDHTSVLEHAVYTVMVTGVSRSLTHELVRHRHVSPSQLSQRYVDESACEVVVPPALQGHVYAAQAALRTFMLQFHWDDEHAALQRLIQNAIKDKKPYSEYIGFDWLLGVADAGNRYKRISDFLSGAESGNRTHTQQDSPTTIRKKAREAARSVLLNATETKLQLTLNAQAARHLFYRRGSRHADAEIRRLAGLIFDVLSAASPNLFQDISKLPDGTLASPLWREEA